MTVQEVRFSPTEAAYITDLPLREIQKAFDEGWFHAASKRRIRGMTRRHLGPAELIHLRLMKQTAPLLTWRNETKKALHRSLRQRVPDLLIFCGDLVLVFEIKSTSHDHVARLVGRYEAWANQRAVRQESDAMHFVQSLTKDADPKVAVATIVPLIADLGDAETWRPFLERMNEQLSDPVRIDSVLVEPQTVWQSIKQRFADAAAAQFAIVSDPEIRGGEPVLRGTRIPVHMLASLVDQGASTEELLEDYPSLNERSLQLGLLYAAAHPRSGRPAKRPWIKLTAE